MRQGQWLFLKSSLKKSEVTCTACLIGRCVAIMKPLVHKLQVVGGGEPFVKRIISLQSVLNQKGIDLKKASNIYKETCRATGVKELAKSISSWGTSISFQRLRWSGFPVFQTFRMSYIHRQFELLSLEAIHWPPFVFAMLLILPPINPIRIYEIERLNS